MIEIKSALNSQPVVHEPMLTSKGVCVWIVWGQAGQPDNASDILHEAGAMNIANILNQSLWFFFSPDVAINTLARLDLWAKQYSYGMMSYIFPSSLVVGVDHVKAVDIPKEFLHLRTEVSNTRSYIYLHPSYAALATSIPGLSIFDVQTTDLHDVIPWKMTRAERRLPFSVEQGWFAIVHPLGNPIDKQFQRGWQTFSQYMERFITEHKLKYSVFDNFLMLPLENLNIVREWLSFLISTIESIREQHSDMYWPCVNAVVDKNNLNFTPDLPQKVGLDWNELSPDIPYLSYKNALVLGEGFVVKDIVYSSARTDMEAYCTIGMKSYVTNSNNLSVLMPESLVPGKNPCFYCGASNHSAKQCPSKHMQPVSSQYFSRLNDINLNDLNGSFREIDNGINKVGVKAYLDFVNENDTSGKLLKAIFAINHMLQLPNISRIWRITNRDIDATPDLTPTHKADPNYILLQRFIKCSPQDMHGFERECHQLLHQQPKNWHIHCILGFILMEKGDLDRAVYQWSEADKLCTITLHQAWLKFLVARAREIQGRYTDAIENYHDVLRLLPGWNDPQYRIMVCNMKRGFTDRVARQFGEIVNKAPHMFHKIVLDPELIRGQFHLLNVLQRYWNEAYNRFFVERAALEALHNTIQEWFGDDKNNPIPEQTKNVEYLLSLGEIKNYILFLEVSKERPILEAEITEAIEMQISQMKGRYEKSLFKLEFIRDEMSWFHLQKTLTNFNNLFNSCAKILNWAFGSDFTDPKIFKVAREKLNELEENVKQLEKKLNALQMVRDVTLFSLLTLRTFVKIAMFFLPVALVVIFSCMFLGNYIGMGDVQGIVRSNFWTLIKVVCSLTLMLCLGFATLKTTVIFEKKRRELINKAKNIREQKQKERVEKVRNFKNSFEKEPEPDRDRYS